jgi:hypothetical protein
MLDLTFLDVLFWVSSTNPAVIDHRVVQTNQNHFIW